MDIYGKVAQILKSIAGNMQICTLDDKTIALFNPLSNNIACLDIPTSRKTYYFQIQMFILTSSYQYTIIGYHFNEWIQAHGVAFRCVECETALISE
jgi:hypothetical protein